VITFGSMVADLPEKIALKFLEVFRNLPQYRFFWRFDNSKNMNIPSNVWASTWLPQDSLLAHDKVLLFITHGGYNGLLESLYYAKPMIVFSLFGDQHYNAKCMQYKGYAKRMNIHEFTADELSNNIQQVISDNSYKNRVTKASEIMKTDIQNPLEKTIWWIEHLVQFGGEHLQSAGNELAWYQYWMFDVLLVLSLAVTSVSLCLFLLCKCIIRRCCCSKNRKQATKLKKQ